MIIHQENNSFPMISVITPSFNQGHFLERTIRSVIDQKYPNLEFIIIDGGSTDNTIDIIKKYESYLTYWISEKDNGQSDGFNKGLKLAKGDIVGWLNSDDIYINDAFKQAMNFFRSHPDSDIVFSDYYFIDENDRIIRKRKEIPFDFNIYLWTRDCYHANCAGFFKKEVFNKCGGLLEDLHYTMDLEFYMRAYKKGFKISHYPEFWGAFRVHDKSKTTSRKNLYLQKSEGKLIFSMYMSKNVSSIKGQIKKSYYDKVRKIKKLIYGCYW